MDSMAEAAPGPGGWRGLENNDDGQGEGES